MTNSDRSRTMTVLTILFTLLCCAYLSAGAMEYTGLTDYQDWALYNGYPRGMLIPLGLSGINQDYFHSLPGTAGYSSGRIVIGDSRSCQLGIRQDLTGGDDYAVFAVWGGHYVPGTGTSILTDTFYYDFEQCFHEQIRTSRSCTVFFFATINDYDYSANQNAGYISAAVSAAETIASMTWNYEGTEYHPKVIVIGTEGGRTTGDIFGIPQGTFNRYIDSYNRDLRTAVTQSPLLKETAPYFTTVREITGGRTTFISDGLHYSDTTLQTIANYIKTFR